MLLPVRRSRRNGFLSEENVRASEIRGPMVGYFLPQTRRGAIRFKATGGTAHRTPYAKYFECGECEGRRKNSVKQLAEVLPPQNISLQNVVKRRPRYFSVGGKYA